MQLDRDEPIRAFAARLKGRAGVCSFNIKCSSDTCAASTDYSDVMIQYMLIRCLKEEEIRLSILGESRQDILLEDAFCCIEAKESGKRPASHLVEDGSSTVAATSSYKRQDKPCSDGGSNSSLSTTCGECGRSGQSSSRQEHMTKCPAW
ncbi:hypothetical protein PoB_001869200 [Plakobranchus ocellatus]|uniref:Uncharacterized protein n=1 Tax=Plakobranchus ocellatus TaxID=259542 RepID=A0AAV3ZCH8_9GAST|nr:hypothetical protein PoB_001869200 [Plakobranchus ocellatus]